MAFFDRLGLEIFGLAFLALFGLFGGEFGLKEFCLGLDLMLFVWLYFYRATLCVARSL